MRFLAVLLVLGGPLAAQQNLFNQPAVTEPGDKTGIEATALFSIPPPGGYLPVEIRIVNQHNTDARFRFDCESATESGYGSNSTSQVASEFTLGAASGTTGRHELLVPVATDYGSGGYGYRSNRVSVRMSGSFGSNAGSLGGQFAENAPAVLMSEPLHTPNGSALDAEVNAASSTRGGSGRDSFAASFDPGRLPADWRAYCGYDQMLLTDTDWTGIADGARHAILQWCRLGGRLEIHTTNAATSFATLGIDVTGTGPMNFGFGHVELRPLGAALTLDAKSTVSRCMGGPPIHSLTRSVNSDYSASWPLHAAFGNRKFSYALFVVVLIAFGILVGPVNLFVFAKSGQRHKLFITTPIISLGASALLILLILVKDGVGGGGQRIALIEIRPDAGENNAYVLQEQISRTGVLLGGSFTVSEAAAITPVPIADSAWSRLSPGDFGGGLRYTMNFNDGKLDLSGDWFQSRSEQGQLVRAVVPTRGRIELKSESGAPTLLSTFEFPLDTLYYADRSGGFWTARNLQPGNAVPCASISAEDYAAAVRDEAARLGKRHAETLSLAAERKDHFVATSGAASPVGTYTGIRWKDDHTILTGPVLR